jgi:hypothetical protein
MGHEFHELTRIELVNIMAVSINLGTSAKSVGLTCGSANPAAQQRRPTTRCVNVVVICYSAIRVKVSRGATTEISQLRSGWGCAHEVGLS